MNDLVAPSHELATDLGETTEVSWTAPTNLTFEQYQSIGNTFQQIQRSLNWWMGDWLNAGEERFGDMYLQAIDDTRKAYETLIKWKAVAQRLPKEIRQKDLSWTHHFYVAYVDADQRGDLLRVALNINLSSRELKEVAKLSYNHRADLIAAADEGMSKEDFLRLVNKFRLGAVDVLPAEKKERPKKEEGDDEEEEVPFSDIEGDEDAYDYSPEASPGLDYDTVLDFWNNHDLPMTFCGLNQAIWGDISVRAAQDEEGRLVLVWEKTDDDTE